MRSKTDKAGKTKAASAGQSATTKKKLGRPKKSDAEKAATKANKLKAAPKAAKAQKVAKMPKQKKSEKMAAALWQQTFDKIEVLVSMGAVQIKLDGVEVVFPPNVLLQRAANGTGSTFSDSTGQTEYSVEEVAASVSQLAKVAPLDNPDEYAEAQDRWVNHDPLPRI